MVFLVVHFLSSILNVTVVTVPFTLKKQWACSLLNSEPAAAFFALGDCGLFHCYNCCFVSGL
jgi:hypothetical protein